MNGKNLIWIIQNDDRMNNEKFFNVRFNLDFVSIINKT